MTPLPAALAAALWLFAPPAAALRVAQQPGQQTEDISAPGRMLHRGVLHFMFELKDQLQHPGIWGKFFSQALPGTYMAWAHCTDYHACEQDYMMKLVKVRLVPQVYSQRGADLINPFVHMIRLAMAETAHLAAAGVVEKFLVISDATLPIKPFSHIHWDQTSRPESDICISNPTQWARTVIQGVPLALVKHHQWLSINRHDAKALVDDWVPLKKARAWNMTVKEGHFANHPIRISRTRFQGGAWFTATDEEVVYQRAFGLMVLPQINDTRPMWKLFDERRCITYVDWPDNVYPQGKLEGHVSLLQSDAEAANDLQRHTTNFTKEVTNELLKDPSFRYTIANGIMHPFKIDQISDTGLWAFRNSQYLFARKFSNCANLPNFTEIMFS